MIGLFISVALAQAAPPASLCVEGTAVTEMWSGEYPGPVIQVLRAVTLSSRRAVCDPVPSRPCTLQPGLIHPWAGVESQHFRAIAATSTFELRQPLTVFGEDEAEHTLPVGTKVIERNYLSEGMCALVVEGVRYGGECPSQTGEGERFHQLSAGPKDFKPRQFAGVECAQGYLGWILVDEALFQHAEVQPGEIKGFGEIGPAE